ncbi:DEAD-domain-containing protein [Blastocladiella britannica]|nr:DEAD-domain-containing protein [Blastocladiella britannica]
MEHFDAAEILVHLHNRDDPNSPLYSVSLFEDLGLKKELLHGLYLMGFNKPSKIQERALPLMLRDPPTNLIAQSQSGTGKTGAFVLGMLARIDFDATDAVGPQAVCLVNARELAVQVHEVMAQMAVHLSALQSAVVTQGSRAPPRTTHAIVATPGRLLDLVQRRQVDLGSVKILVLDEADSMVDPTVGQNLAAQAAALRRAIPETAQCVLFSATFPDRVMRFAENFAPQANVMRLPLAQVKVDAIMQFALSVGRGIDAKLDALGNIYGLVLAGQSLVFVDRRNTAYQIAEYMRSHGFDVGVLTAADEPAVRDKTMADFRDGNIRVLITTNVLSRGIDISSVGLVINFDLPVKPGGRGNTPDMEAYLHRIGRTGRFGRAGVAINLIDGPNSESTLEQIRRHYGMEIHRMTNDLDEMERIMHSVQAL